MLNCYQFMKRKLIFITKILYIYIYIFFLIQESYFYAEDKKFNLKLSKMLYYNILRCLFADVLMFKHELPLNKKIPYLGYAD